MVNTRIELYFEVSELNSLHVSFFIRNQECITKYLNRHVQKIFLQMRIDDVQVQAILDQQRNTQIPTKRGL